MSQSDSPSRKLFDKKATVLLDGGVGSELARRGFSTVLPLWSARALLEDAGVCLLETIHREYALAGAEILTTNTFRTTRRALERAGKLAEWRAINRRAVQCARAAADSAHHACVVAGSIAPLEDCYRPDLVPPQQECLREHAMQVELLTELGVDLLLIETMNCLREAEAAVRAARNSGVDFLLSLCPKTPFQLLSGEPLDQVLPVLVEAAGPRLRGLLLNCATLEALSDIYPRFSRLPTGLPHGLYAHIGEPDEEVGWKVPLEQDPEGYADWIAQRLDDNARFVGGCCGTTPDHIAAVAALLRRQNQQRQNA